MFEANNAEAKKGSKRSKNELKGRQKQKSVRKYNLYSFFQYV